MFDFNETYRFYTRLLYRLVKKEIEKYSDRKVIVRQALIGMIELEGSKFKRSIKKR